MFYIACCYRCSITNIPFYAVVAEHLKEILCQTMIRMIQVYVHVEVHPFLKVGVV